MQVQHSRLRLYAGTVTKSPFRFLPYFSNPAAKRKTVFGLTVGGLVVFALAAAATVAFSQDELATQLANLAL